jgi:hypothetical protein
MLTGLVALSELCLAGVIYVSVAAPDRTPFRLAEIPLFWRLLGLLAWSIFSGALIQLTGTVSALR